MSYTVGQQAIITTVARDSGGVPTDATVSVLVTRPDGTTVSPSVAHPGTGQYNATVSVTMPGTFFYLWTASGAAVGVDDGQFDAVAATQRIVSLAEVKKHLNKTSTDDDEELQDFIDAAQSMIEREIGEVTPKTVSEYHDGGGYSITLWNGPVVSITSVTEYMNGTLLKVLTTNEYRLDTAGFITRHTSSGAQFPFQGGCDDVLVTYIAGRAQPISPHIRLAAKELTAHLWRNTQLGRTRRGTRAVTDEDAAPSTLNFSMPNRIREILGAKRPIIL